MSEKDKLIKIWNREISLTIDEKKNFIEKVTNKESRAKWSKRIFGEKSKKISTSNTTKAQRFEKLIDLHENSTLNRERGMDNIRAMRCFLQSPAEDKRSDKSLSIKFAIETIQEIEQYENQ